MMKACLTILCILLLALGAAAQGSAESDADTLCTHLWVPYNKEIHGLLPEEVELTEVTELIHVYMQRSITQVCVLCGERMYNGASGSEVPHAYTVTQWEKTREGKATQITLTCGICGYVYTYEVTKQMLEEGSGKSCLQGGACPKNKDGYLFENGMILFDTHGYQWPVDFEPGELLYPSMVIYDAEEKTFMPTTRKYCPTCGRPRTSGFPAQTTFDDNMNGLPIMTMEYFMTNGVPKNLPYQLLDQIRQEEEPACDHRWVSFDASRHEFLPEEVKLTEVTDEHHVYTWYYPKTICELCGARQGHGNGSGSFAPHAYTVTGWQRSEDGAAVEITLTCGVCQHTYTYELAVQTILDGSGADCLHGGSCKTNIVASLFENGMILPDWGPQSLPYGFETGERLWYHSLVYVAELDAFYLTARVHCPVCGRPRPTGYQVPPVRFNPNWNGIPIMDEEYFLTNGVPKNLPYQLLDQIRQEDDGEAGAA